MPLSKEFILTLLKTPKIGMVSAKAINSHSTFKISSVNELFDLIVDTKAANSKIPLPDIKDLIVANNLAQQMLNECERKGVKVITANDNLYPIKLMRLSDYPVILYVKGSVDAMNAQLTAAVIGTREPSPFGLKAGKRVASILGNNGFTIVSGLAIGCDTAGHQGALDAGTPTVAALASGVNIIYPKENQYLADKIVETGGALFSEYELNFRPQRSSFVERDRLQSGLSDGLVVVETDIKGGTMHTVGFAQKLNIPIGCISNHPESLKDFPKINGNKYLISGGAYPIGNPEQIYTFIKRLNPNATEFIGDDKTKENVLGKQADDTLTSAPEQNREVFISSAKEELPIIMETIEKIEERVSVPVHVDKPTDAYNIEEDIKELKASIVKLIAEQQTGNALLNQLILLLSTKEKPVKKAVKGQAELL